jgi:signal transduction histidine kinase
MLVLTDSAGVVLATAAAPAGERLRTRDAIGRPLWDLLIAPGDLATRHLLEEKIAQAAGGEVVRCRVPAPAGGGHTALDLTLTPFDGSDPAERLVLVRTERDRRGVTALVGQAAHEVNNRLGIIRNACTLMGDAVRPGSETAEDLRSIDAEVDRIVAVMKDLYDRIQD